VRADGFADAMAVSALAAHQVRPILLVNPTSLPSETATALDGVTTATIVGSTPSVSQAVSDAIATHVTTVTPRLAGSDRYGTSAAVAKAAVTAGMDASNLWLATGRNWPDAVAAGPAIAATGAVLLLVDPTDLSLSAASKQFLAGSPASTAVTILGSPASVMVQVEGQILGALPH
jgi:putative cell wall-binding protein